MADTLADVLRVEDTDANIGTTIRERQLGFTTDTHELAFKATGGTVYRFTSEGNDVTGGNLYTEEYIYHVGDTDNYNRYRADQQTTVIGGVTFADMVEGATDYINFLSNTLYIDGTAGQVSIGSTVTPVLFNVLGTGIADAELRISSSFADATTKHARIATSQYTDGDSSTGVSILWASAGASDNIINYGGGHIYSYASTEHRWYTAANATTATGTLRVTIGSSGNVNMLTDGAELGFGADTEVTLKHVHNTGLLLNSTSQLQFGDSGTYIYQSSDGVLSFVADISHTFTGPVTFNSSYGAFDDVIVNKVTSGTTIWADVSTGYFGIGGQPGNFLDVRTGATTSSAFHLGEATNEGVYIASYADSTMILGAGTEYVSGSHTARATSANSIIMAGGNMTFYADTSLTDGNTYSPSLAFSILNTGNCVVANDIYTTAHTSYTATLTSTTGGDTIPTYTSVDAAYYRKTGNDVRFHVCKENVTGGTNGSGTGTLRMALPVSVHSDLVGSNIPIASGKIIDGTTTGKAILGYAATADTMEFEYVEDGNDTVQPGDQASTQKRIKVWGGYEAA